MTELIESIHEDTQVFENPFDESSERQKQFEKQRLEMELFGLTLDQFMNEMKENPTHRNLEQAAINQPRQWINEFDEQLVRVLKALSEGIINFTTE